ncbi:MAG TPA: S8 family serine peptidase [Thermoanaerobaculales bacterium]|nr:S8 family serine peptidase [Thermoanaerobaculales bacterium]HQN95073.1 S8 family serine peptidase [Thermoanaerobaculales bacterium]HQP42218.1 S8 family serine peptidase [Thermoanaerobaculales bacterium]
MTRLNVVSLVAAAAAVVSIVAGGGVRSVALAASPSPSEAVRRPALFKDSRQSLAIARAQGRDQVMLLLAARSGAAAAVAAEAARLGGEVRYREDEVGYLRVRITPDRATELAEHEAVETAAMDYEDSYPARLGGDAQARAPGDATVTGASGAAATTEDGWPPRLGDYPLQHPYSPIVDLAAADFLAAHPTWDGRGVTIALLDGNVDLLLPEFQTAYALDGTPVPKIADFLNVTDPRDDFELNPQWVDMKATVSSVSEGVSFEGKAFTVPRGGTYRIGLFSERRFNMDSNASYIGQDIDRNGNPKGDDGLFGVLWDEATNDVWVDTDRDLSFADEKAMTDYIVRQDVGVFGTDDPATPERDTIGFAVQTDRVNKFVSINVGIYQHATIIMGSVVGNRQPNGRVQGVAPGARIVSMFYGVSNAHGMIEGLIAAFKHPQVDLIVCEQSVAIASLPYLLADGTHPVSVVAQRLIERHGKLLFVPGDNAPAFGFVAEDGLAPGAVSVGGYQSKESYRLNWGFIPENDDNLHWGALSHGPSGSGALKPDLLAPSGQVSTDPGYRKGELRKGLFQLPPGYSVDGGTSTATPMAAGATALVVSAAKQSGVAYDAGRLKAAITGSARHIPRLAVHEQGNGLIQVGPAFDLLTRLEGAPPITITSSAPVRTALSHLLLTPDRGVGLYEREGWTVGRTETREITLTRTSGPSEPMIFALSWIGNDGTFAGPASVTLPLGAPVAVPVTVTSAKEGAHTAILSIDHPSCPAPVHRVLAAIVVPYRFTAENGHSVTAELTPPLPGDTGLFVEVPPGAEVLQFSASSPSVGLGVISPDKEMLFACPFKPEGTTEPCTVVRPHPGVWEINVSNARFAFNFDATAPVPLKGGPVSITATLLGVEATADASTSAALGVGGSQPLTLELANRFGKVSAGAVPLALASASRSHGTVAEGEQRVHEVTVPEGATSLHAAVSVSGPAADVDVYLLDCTVPEEKPASPAEELEKGNTSPAAPPPICAPRAKATDVGAGGAVEVASPKAGRWLVVVDGYSVPSGPVEYEVVDLFTHPALGAIAVADLTEPRTTASTWTAKANAWVASLPEPPRRLAGRVVVASPQVTRAGGEFGQGPAEAVALGSTIVWLPVEEP